MISVLARVLGEISSEKYPKIEYFFIFSLVFYSKELCRFFCSIFSGEFPKKMNNTSHAVYFAMYLVNVFSEDKCIWLFFSAAYYWLCLPFECEMNRIDWSCSQMRWLIRLLSRVSWIFFYLIATLKIESSKWWISLKSVSNRNATRLGKIGLFCSRICKNSTHPTTFFALVVIIGLHLLRFVKKATFESQKKQMFVGKATLREN